MLCILTSECMLAHVFAWSKMIKNNLKLSRGEIIGVEFGNRQTDKFFDTIYGGMGIFLSVKFATSLLASLAGG